MSQNGPAERDSRADPAAPLMADFLRPELGSLAREVIEEIGAQVPAVGGLLTGEAGAHALRAVVREVEGFLAWAIAGEPPPVEHGMRVHEAFIARAFTAGCTHGVLQAAYQIGARIVWRRVAGAGVRAGVDPEYMYHLADSIFARLEKVSGESSDVFDHFETAPQRAQRELRQRLVRLLLSDITASPQAIEALAREARWQVPGRVACVALDGPEAREAAPFGFDNDVLPDLDRSGPCLVVPADNPAARHRMIRRSLVNVTHAIGPAVDLGAVPLSMALARHALALVKEGLLPHDSGQVRCDEHLATLHLTSNEGCLRLLRRTVLEPLADLTPDRRLRLSETLLAWLGCAGTLSEVAARLCVHPQTVRYRMRQLEDLFGAERLRDPDWRFEMQLALRSWELEHRRTEGQGSFRPQPA
ncbi:PucR family transcriptional regulator [Actinomadura nitritigenes]|uniref:PucR family transcriptional regulator n=1 Tax=Actinomadura nitritigenes TaxID=134602 RepID=UPI003D8CBB97